MKKELTNVYSELAALVQRGVDAWTEAGKIVVDLVDNQGMTLDGIADAVGSPMLSAAVLAQFERIGRAQVMPEWLVLECPAQKHVLRLPLSEQRKIWEKPIELTVIRDGKTDVLNVRAKELTRPQCKQVFAHGGIRSAGAQRAWIESQTAPPGKMQELPYDIHRGKLRVRNACEFSARELALILAQMEA